MDLNHLPSVIGKYITASNKPDPTGDSGME
ncbi:hypothetical protein QF041_000951 [Paenibacillus sp. W2I17]|nr:hypothetical protein [Paenibacillus sp. W2I17]